MYQKHTWISREIIRREYLQNIEDGIYNEQERAIAAENALAGNITTETARAVAKENELSSSVQTLTTDVSGEIQRATAKENELADSITNEIQRATTAENALSTSISNINDSITTESNRAIARENAIADSLASEIQRATTAESSLHDYVDSKISTVFKPSGSILFANLPPLIAENLGNVYDVIDSFTTTADFLEGAGKSYPAGTNVGIITRNDTYYYDAMSGFVDLSDYVQKTDRATTTDLGLVKPDGSTITIDQFGVITAVGGGGGSGSGEEAEAWAVGERNGVPVSVDDVTYHNNSKYYAGLCEEVLQKVEAYAALIGVVVGTLYVTSEEGDHFITEDGDNIILDY